MNDQANDRFRVRPGPPKTPRSLGERSFIARVAARMGKSGGSHNGLFVQAPGRGARRGRGYAVARLLDSHLGSRARRVAIKTRLVVLKTAGARSVAMHLRYIVRDGVSRDGGPSHAYGPTTDMADVKAFEELGRNDRHQFRMIVAPEDGLELHDLRGFTRALMNGMERDLGTRLEWIAVDHWDTGHPHVHVVLRGRDQSGENLVIGREYISRGMRARASELATVWLGPRTDREIQESLWRDVDLERWTPLDQVLRSRIRDGVIDLNDTSSSPGDRRGQSLLIGRLQRLERLGLARKIDSARWTQSDNVEAVLRALGERGDIIRTMQRTFGEVSRELAIFEARSAPSPVVGRIVGKGIDEATERPYAIVDGVDGRGHYVSLPLATDLADLPRGAIVEARTRVDRPMDRTIATVAADGWYRPDRHLAQLQGGSHPVSDAKNVVARHVRRLEALRQAGVVDRVSREVWRVPKDLVAQGRAFDRHQLGDIDLFVHSRWPIERQVRAVGATWLDQQLTSAASLGPGVGFSAAVHSALRAREDFLVEEGLAQRLNRRVVVANDLVSRLRARELARAGAGLEAETGLVQRPTEDGVPVTGIYRRSLNLASGRFAMLDDGIGFSLVPWRRVIENRQGQTMTALVQNEHVTWRFGREKQLGR